MDAAPHRLIDLDQAYAYPRPCTLHFQETISILEIDAIHRTSPRHVRCPTWSRSYCYGFGLSMNERVCRGPRGRDAGCRRPPDGLIRDSLSAVEQRKAESAVASAKCRREPSCRAESRSSRRRPLRWPRSMQGCRSWYALSSACPSVDGRRGAPGSQWQCARRHRSGFGRLAGPRRMLSST